ncbi:glycosyltransferase family 1 protein [Favolaschia claudopus]|uniref:sucrose-phosphate synthase n=1 Tax=Favolaschia claudopus TaxID=2862362 RepID=A0AAW0ABW8_9AGAR
MVLRIAFLNPQGNFDSNNTGIGEHPDFGGQLIYVRELSQCLAKRHGVDIDIITRRFHDDRWPAFSHPIDCLPVPPANQCGQVRILRIPCGPQTFLKKEDLWPHLEEWVQNIVDFYLNFEGKPPDASAGHYADGGLACALLQEISRIPFASFTAHSLGAQKRDALIRKGKPLGEFNFPARFEAEMRCMRDAFRIVVSTDMERCEQYAHPVYNPVIDVELDRGRFVCIPPGINVDVFGPTTVGTMDESTVQRFMASVDREIPTHRRDLPVVIAAGRLDFKKNHISIVQAFAKHRSLRTNANLVLLVSGGIEAFRRPEECGFSEEELQVAMEVKRVIEEAMMEGDCVVVPGLQNTQSELAAIFRHLGRTKQGIFCDAAHYEPFGLMVLEAIVAGIPAVCTKNGGPSESLRRGHEQYAVLVDVNDIEELSEGLHQLVASGEKWEEYQRKGQSHVLDRFTWDKAADQYLRVIVDAIDERVSDPK